MSSQKSKILHLDGFLLSKSYKVSAEKVQKSYLSWHWRVMQNLKKNWLEGSIMTRGFFVQSIQGLSYKNTEELAFMALNSDEKFE